MKKIKKVLIVFGTRPEAIKMAPLVKEFNKYCEFFDTKVCVTAQHREMLDQVLEFFEINPDYDLDLMKKNQTLNSIFADILVEMKIILDEFNPDYVFVHGDTATSTAVALSAFFNQCKICHIEAGLRTFDKWSPFPEEMNRQITGRLADIHFAPTEQAQKNLLEEKVAKETIFVTGNTVIDALHYSVQKVDNTEYTNSEIENLKKIIDPTKKLILVTGHRRENFGQGFENICNALLDISKQYPSSQIIYPVHLNPNVQNTVNAILADKENIYLISPLSYPSFVWLMNHSYLIITDSGGVQEEAPSLGKAVLVMRDTTERPEAVAAGTVSLVGTNRELIVSEALKFLTDEKYYNKISKITNPYGDGHACERVIMELKK